MRSRAWTFISAGESIGTIIAFVCCPLLVQSFGWPSIFYFSAVLSLAWLVLFGLLGSHRPDVKPRFGSVSPRELVYIQRRTSRDLQENVRSPFPWKNVFTSVSYWSCVTTHVCFNYSGYLALSWIPDYFKTKFGVDSGTLAVTALLPYAALFILTNVAGILSDYVQRKGLSLTHTRKLANTIGLGVQAFFFWMLCGLGPNDLVLAVVYLTLAVGFGGFAAAGYWVSYLDMSSEHGATMLGIGNSIATIPGILGQIITGAILHNHPDDWSLVYTIVACVNIFGMLVYIFGFSLNRTY